MKIATWNVNSLRVRLPHLIDWLAVAQPELVCLQELKLEQSAFPLEAIRNAGYYAAWLGQKTYNGVAILSRQPIEEASIQCGIPNFNNTQSRLIAINYLSIKVICGYFPNGQSLDSDKFVYKMNWLNALFAWLKQEIASSNNLILAGDFNIAPDDRDVYDPVLWHEKILCSTPEREAFNSLLSLGLYDAFRLFEQAPRIWSWWDYRELAFRKNKGLRIDHLLVSEALRSRCQACYVEKSLRALAQPSDHAPVVLDML